MTAALTLRVSSMLGELLYSLPLRATGQVADHEPPDGKDQYQCGQTAQDDACREQPPGDVPVGRQGAEEDRQRLSVGAGHDQEGEEELAVGKHKGEEPDADHAGER